jgi:hypothetical protein
MEQGPREVNAHSTRQDIPLLLLNQKICYRIHKSPLLVHILSLSYTLTPCVLNVNFHPIYT